MGVHAGHQSAGEAEVVPTVARVESFDALQAEWDALAEPNSGVFATSMWSRVWWTHFGQGRELLLHALRAGDGALTCVVPLYAWHRRTPRVVRFLGHGPGDELGPVIAPSDNILAAHALRTTLDVLTWDVFFGEQLSGDREWSRLLKGHPWRREASPVLHVPAGGWEEYLDGRSANFRQQLRRRERELGRAGSVRTRLADEKTLGRDLDTLFSLHRARWGERPSDFSDTPFHRDLAREALARGWLRLWLLEVDGRPVAAWHGFQVGSVASYYQAGRDPAYERFSVGFVLLARTIRAAIEEGATEYRFGRGDEPFKLRFTDDDPGLESVVLLRGRTWTAAYQAARAARFARQRRLRTPVGGERLTP